MRKLLYIIILLFFVSIIILFTYLLSKQCALVISCLNTKNNNFHFIYGKIINKSNFKDDEIDLKIKNILFLKKEVYRYQWIEQKELLKKTNTFNYTYSKQWKPYFADSNKFQDKTKNNYTKKHFYKSKIIAPNQIILDNNYSLDAKYIKSNKKKFEIVKFPFNYKTSGKIINKNYNFNYEKREEFADLDSYVSANIKETAVKEKDKFEVFNDYILYNGKDIYNPEIGDTKIIYKTFSPDVVSFLGNVEDNKLTPYNKYISIDFSEKNKDDLLNRIKIKFIIELAIYINFIIYIVDKILSILKNKSMKEITLKVMPYFNEYFVYTKYNKTNNFLITVLLLSIVIQFYYITALASFILIILRNVDYYSI